jgi:spore coat polysaccharide biosynthesis protein SpsF
MVKNKICIIQARTRSKRLPFKVLKNINGKPLIFWVILRMLETNIYDKIVIAIPKNDKILADIILKFFLKKVNIFRGPEKNVIKRFYLCAKKYNAHFITRVTADDPFKDINLCRKSFKYFINSKLDYYSNTIRQTYPIGIDIEHFTFSLLNKIYKKVTNDYDKEHVTSYIIKNKKKFNVKNFYIKKNLSNIRLTIDNNVDLENMRVIYKHFKSNILISYKKIVKYLKTNEKK